MRLINTTTFELKEFSSAEIPQYAILSHTWGDDEVTLLDMANPDALPAGKFEKIRRTCEEAKRAGFEYCWVDTCCIDKTSSAELSESINSMFQWYSRADVCYVLLSDLKQPEEALEVFLPHCRWFTRGWTLQELLAPSRLVFFDNSWGVRGIICVRYVDSIPAEFRIYRESESAQDLTKLVSDITGIPRHIFSDINRVMRTPAAEVMSWASQRQTTRVEDMAYSLLGLFDVNMPLLYGEGPKAFVRLQEEILLRRGDLSLLAWLPNEPCEDYCGNLARSPADFGWCLGSCLQQRQGRNVEVNITNRGLRLTVKLCLYRPVSGISWSEQLRNAGSCNYFLDLKLTTIPHAQMEGLSLRPFEGAPTLVDSFVIGIHLRKCGPFFFCRQHYTIDNFSVVQRFSPRQSEVMPIGGTESRPVYLALTTSISDMARDHPLVDRMMLSNVFSGFLTGPSVPPERLLTLYDSCRALDFRFSQQSCMQLGLVVNACLWDMAHHSFISTTSDHARWDAVFFTPRDPRGFTLPDVILFILSMDDIGATPPLTVLAFHSESVNDLNRMTKENYDLDTMLAAWPELHMEHKVAVHDRSRFLKTRRDRLAVLDNQYRSQYSPTVHGRNWYNDPEYLAAKKEIDAIPFTSNAMRVTTPDGKWSIIAEIYLTPPSSLMSLGAEFFNSIPVDAELGGKTLKFRVVENRALPFL